MENNKDEILLDVVCEVLEKIAFMFAEPLPKEELMFDDKGLIKASMNFSGELSGSISIIIPDDMSLELASNIMGVEPDDESIKDQALDSLKEVLNVICGQFLTSFGGDEPIFDLTIPEISSSDNKNVDEMIQSPNSLGFLVDEHSVLVQVIIDN